MCRSCSRMGRQIKSMVLRKREMLSTGSKVSREHGLLHKRASCKALNTHCAAVAELADATAYQAEVLPGQLWVRVPSAAPK